MSITINPVCPELLKLPVVLTPRAWQEAVHIEEPQHVAEIGTRLGDVVLLALREVHLQPQAPRIDFGIYRFPPHGDRSERVWLELRLHRVESGPGHSYLCITLRDEEPSYVQ